jgi:hypothetical protein
MEAIRQPVRRAKTRRKSSLSTLLDELEARTVELITGR